MTLKIGCYDNGIYTVNDQIMQQHWGNASLSTSRFIAQALEEMRAVARKRNTEARFIPPDKH